MRPWHRSPPDGTPVAAGVKLGWFKDECDDQKDGVVERQSH